ncbi:MAG: hypothetical protein WCL70_10440 [Paludibacter sp.]
MKQKLLVIAVMAAIILSASANLTIGLRNKTIANPSVAILKTQQKSKKTQVIVPQFNQLSTLAKVRAVDPISTFPYKENFDAADITTDGWLITDASTTTSDVMSVGSLSGLPSLSGSTYLISGYDASASRNAWAFSPAMSLTAGVTYHVYVWAYAPGYNSVNDEFKVTVGTNQTAATQTTLVIDKTGANSVVIDTWTRLEGTYTPSTSGNYNFAISHCTAAMDVDAVAFENFAVSDNAYVEPPILQAYSKGGLWSATAVVNDSVYLYGNESINYVPQLLGATSFSWIFDADATASSTTDTIPSVTYATSGFHSATLSATGPGGTTIKDVNHYLIRPAAGVTSDIVYNIKSYDSFADYQTSSTNTNMYLAGPNTNYKKIAEKFVLPAGATVSLSQIYLYVGNYTLSTANRAKTFTIQILKADGAGGIPGTVVSSVTPTYSTLFGATAITTSTMKSYTYTTPVTITGSFYISLDFTNVGTPSATNHMGLLTTAGRPYADCSLYAYYSSAWTSISDVFGIDISGFIAPKIAFQTVTAVETPSISALNAFVSNNALHVQNATAGGNLMVFDLTGNLLISHVLKTGNDVLPISLRKGIYLVKVGEKTAKVMIN